MPSGNTTYTLVNIRNGTYTEIVDTRTKNNITFRGQSRTGTVVGYPNNNNKNGSTHSRMAFKVFANDIAIENLTLINTTPQGRFAGGSVDDRHRHQAVHPEQRRSGQLAGHNSGNTSGTQAYFKNSLIQGDFDYIWGGMNAFFTNCEIRCLSVNSHVTQARTDPGSNGMSFVNCQVTKATGVTSNSCDLGRTDGLRRRERDLLALPY